LSKISDKLQQKLLSWPGVTIHDHRFGGIEFRVIGREMRHLHSDEMADLPYPKGVGKKLIAEARHRRTTFYLRLGGSAIISIASTIFMVRYNYSKCSMNE
jgi:luciferase-like monooxygenase